MEQDNEKGLTDWLYNRYVEALRKSETKEMTIYWTILNRCAYGMNLRKFGTLRRYAKERIKVINTAFKSGKAKKMLFTGDEGIKEFEQTISAYEKNLREMLFSEENIKKMVTVKRLNYGND